ncbi:LysR family transcriptional regulator [Paeniglutamicibacter antarcticus]|uniref:LysR family transcriptional regulator n=1 Tax=Arthrobacter terrae TaxID=2935737 RepID=A0A931CP40_9MICC|nr:LysR family transcriptional regulator [Arthrobacter terrae]MBG0738414.1 LysR family transcriptional regulator [Arthrobacter terrae]
MEIHQLRMLRELGELGSVTAVAQALFVTPSAVSQQLAALQKSAGAVLTRKQGRRLVLTEAGRVLADAGADVLSAMADARAAIGAYQDNRTGHVTVSGFHSAGQALFAPLVRLLQSPGSPKVQLSDEDVAQQDFPALAARYDLVLAHRMDHSKPWPAGRVSVMELAREPLDVALAVAHPLAALDALTPDDVAGHDWVTSRGGYSPADVLAAVGAVSSKPPTVVHRINDYSTVAALVATGSVLGLLPRYTASPALSPGVTLRPLRGISTHRRIDILARPESLKRRSVLLVIDALHEAMAEMVSR